MVHHQPPHLSAQSSYGFESQKAWISLQTLGVIPPSNNQYEGLNAISDYLAIL